METLTTTDVRRLALARAGLLSKRWSELPRTAKGGGAKARAAAHAVIGRFGYLQLDTVSVAGARSQAIFLLSRLKGIDPSLAEELLRPGEPLFEYWGHEVSYLPIELYPCFAFARRALKRSGWVADALRGQKSFRTKILKRIRDDGPIRSMDLEGSSTDWWGHKSTKRVVLALWSSGILAVRERRYFQRTFDLAERVIPKAQRDVQLRWGASIRRLLELAFDGHGWAREQTLIDTWRLRRSRDKVRWALDRMVKELDLIPCALETDGRRVAGWIRPAHLALAHRLRRASFREDDAVLLTPFDPMLWDRQRVQQLFGFEQILEIYKPAPQRRWGYFCLPVLCGEQLVARVDLKADRAGGTLTVRAFHAEAAVPATHARRATRIALDRYAGALALKLIDAPRG